MKTTTLTNCNLEELLATLPALSRPCYLCSRVGNSEIVRTDRPAVLREPSTGCYLCARCVTEHIAGWPEDRDGIERVVHLTLRASALSRRETEVLRRLSQGHSDTEIAQAMCIERSSVTGYVCYINDKLGLRGRTKLVICALQIGLVELGDIQLSMKEKEVQS